MRQRQDEAEGQAGEDQTGGEADEGDERELVEPGWSAGDGLLRGRLCSGGADGFITIGFRGIELGEDGFEVGEGGGHRGALVEDVEDLGVEVVADATPAGGRDALSGKDAVDGVEMGAEAKLEIVGQGDMRVGHDLFSLSKPSTKALT